MACPWDRPLNLLQEMFSCDFMKSNGLSSAQKNLNRFFTEDLLMTFFFLFESAERLSKIRDYINICHPSMSFSFEKKKMESCHY